jgi:hypothetical protein
MRCEVVAEKEDKAVDTPRLVAGVVIDEPLEVICWNGSDRGISVLSEP